MQKNRKEINDLFSSFELRFIVQIEQVYADCSSVKLPKALYATLLNKTDYGDAS